MKGLQMTKEAFEAEWWRIVQSGIPYERAYYQLEDRHFKEFGCSRYASYDSFRHSRIKGK